MKQKSGSTQIIAATATLLVVLLLLLMLYFGSVGYDRAALAVSNIPEPDTELADEDIFLDPPLVIGNEDASQNQSSEPEASPLGQPEQADVQSDRLVVNGDNPNPKSKSTEKLITQKSGSALKSEQPKPAKEPESKISSTMASKFGGKNGKPDGKQSMSGSGGKGEGVKGNVRGRRFLGCPLPSVSLRNTETVIVSIRVDEKGRVIEASYKGGTSSSAVNRNKCVSAARKARWSEMPGAAPQGGTITFTLVPRK